MALELRPINYNDLNPRQKESYNFHKVSALLADYGYTTGRLMGDVCQGADFIAQHMTSGESLRVQLTSRLTFAAKYRDLNLYVAFADNNQWYLYPHDELLEKVLAEGLLRNTRSWDDVGRYSFPGLSARLEELLAPYRIPPSNSR